MLIGIICSTVIFLAYAFLCLRANEKSMESLKNTQILMESEKLEAIELEMTELAEDFKATAETMTAKEKKKIKKKATALKKKRDASQKLLEKYQTGKISALDTVALAGYGAISLLGWDINTPIIKRLIIKCQQLKKQDVAVSYSYYMLASLIALSMIGGIVGFAMLSVGIAMEIGGRTVVVFIVPLLLCGIVGYLPLDRINSEVEKRKESIELDFPQVISKLTLLTSAGLEVNQAWQLTMKSGDGVLYEEMKLVSRDIANNVSPSEAYHKMQVKCNDKYVTKLASAITQNISKGNSEIVKYFKELNDESWMERKHSSRRMAEKVQQKLLIPTLLMFAGILIMVIVPVMSGFNMF